MSDSDKANIILVNHREALDYRTNERYSQAVDTTTEYVAAAIDFIAHALFILIQLSIRAAKGWKVAGERAIDLSQNANDLYQEYGLQEKLDVATTSVKRKINELREPDVMVLERADTSLEPEVLSAPDDGQSEEEYAKSA